MAGRLPVYGFRYTEDRNHYEEDEAKRVAVRRLFSLIASGTSVSGTARILTEEGFPAPAGAASRWQRPTVREAVLDDSHMPHSHQEISSIATRSGWPSLCRTPAQRARRFWPQGGPSSLARSVRVPAEGSGSSPAGSYAAASAAAPWSP